jgi:hypothetical protein
MAVPLATVTTPAWLTENPVTAFARLHVRAGAVVEAGTMGVIVPLLPGATDSVDGSATVFAVVVVVVAGEDELVGDAQATTRAVTTINPNSNFRIRFMSPP